MYSAFQDTRVVVVEKNHINEILKTKLFIHILVAWIKLFIGPLAGLSCSTANPPFPFFVRLHKNETALLHFMTCFLVIMGLQLITVKMFWRFCFDYFLTKWHWYNRIWYSVQSQKLPRVGITGWFRFVYVSLRSHINLDFFW